MLNKMNPSRKDVLNDEDVDTGTEMGERKPTPEEVKEIVRNILNDLGSSIPKNAEPAYYSEDKNMVQKKCPMNLKVNICDQSCRLILNFYKNMKPIEC